MMVVYLYVIDKYFQRFVFDLRIYQTILFSSQFQTKKKEW